MQNAEPVAESLLTWMLNSLGPMYTILLPLSALVSFVLVIILVFRGHGAMAVASLMLVLMAPTLIGIFAYTQGSVMSCYVITNGGGTPDPAKAAETMSTALLPPMIAMFLSIPAYAVAAIGTLVRSFGSKNETVRKNA